MKQFLLISLTLISFKTFANREFVPCQDQAEIIALKHYQGKHPGRNWSEFRVIKSDFKERSIGNSTSTNGRDWQVKVRIINVKLIEVNGIYRLTLNEQCQLINKKNDQSILYRDSFGAENDLQDPQYKDYFPDLNTGVWPEVIQ
jgi:hypothetical protein